MKLFSYIFSLTLLISFSCTSNSVEEAPEKAINYEIPAWAKEAIWYQVFVERFRNGDPQNDPTSESIQGSWPHKFGEDWKVTEWTSDWYTSSKGYTGKDFYDLDIQTRRYGGDLQGILDKLDYLEDLGINAIYINPINDAPSLHKFDARNYRHIDINIGPDSAGDLEIMATEDPLDVGTWKWTSADQLFIKLIKELHQRNIKIVVDYSWNHTGIKFWAWKDILKNGKNSKYAHWYEIESFDDPNTPEDEFKYSGWAGVRELPELKKVDVENRVHGKFYTGNIHPEIKQHIFNVSKRWLDPNGDGNFDDGIDGFRLDVADQIGMDFWRDYRNFVRSVNPQTLLVGEIWWESWPDTLMDPRPYVNDGEVFDIVMFYQAYKPARGFFAKSQEFGGAEGLVKGWNEAIQNIPDNTVKSMMMMSASHDSPRLLTSFQNKNKYKYQANPRDNQTYHTGPPDPETIERTKLYLAFQFTMPGAPQIWAGDEMGMWGGDDPDCRKPLWWNDLTFENETSDPYKKNDASHEVTFNQELNEYYKELIQLRKQHPVLRTGTHQFLYAKEDLLIYQRTNESDRIVVMLNNANESVEIPAEFAVEGEDLWQNGRTNSLQPLSAKIVLLSP